MISFFIHKIDYNSLTHCNKFDAMSQKLDHIRVLDRHFEKKKRLMIRAAQTEDSFTGGNTVHEEQPLEENPLCYDSEDEDLIETNKSPKCFLLLGRPCK